MKKKTSVKTCCHWCNAIITMPGGFNEKKNKAVCSQGCRDAEVLFNQLFSEERINRERHYDEITRGQWNATWAVSARSKVWRVRESHMGTSMGSPAHLSVYCPVCVLLSGTCQFVLHKTQPLNQDWRGICPWNLAQGVAGVTRSNQAMTWWLWMTSHFAYKGTARTNTMRQRAPRASPRAKRGLTMAKRKETTKTRKPVRR